MTIESLKNSSTRCELLASRCSSTPSKDPHVEKEEYHPKCALSSRHSGQSPNWVDSAGDEIVGNTCAGTIEDGYGSLSSALMNIIHERCACIRSAPQICTVPGGKGWKRPSTWRNGCTPARLSAVNLNDSG